MIERQRLLECPRPFLGVTFKNLSSTDYLCSEQFWMLSTGMLLVMENVPHRAGSFPLKLELEFVIGMKIQCVCGGGVIEISLFDS